MSTLKATYSTAIDGRDIWVFDDLLGVDELQKLYAILQQSGVVKQEVARPDTEEYKHWITEIPLEQIKGFDIYKRSLEAAESARGQHKIFRSYCNFAGYGDMLFSHTDCPPDVPGLTALWYICTEWDLEWGGETLFFNADRDCRFACSPRPGRLVVFDGALLHVGRPPNRICYAPRYTVAFKMVPPHIQVGRAPQ